MKEIISVRISSVTYDALQTFKLKYNISLTKIIEKAIYEFLMSQKDEWIEEFQKKMIREKKREENQEMLKKLTLINNQARIIRRLQKQGIRGKQLDSILKAFSDEASLYGYTEDEIIKLINNDVVIIEGGKNGKE